LVLNQAVSGISGKITITKSTANTGGNSIYGNEMLMGKSFRVKSVTLGDIFEQNEIDHINLFKIDAEGAEYAILLKAEEKYLKKIQADLDL